MQRLPKMRRTSALYLNSLTHEAQVEGALVRTLPKMDEWIWRDRERGRDFPYHELAMTIVSIRSGVIMKEETKKEFMQYVTQNRINVIVLNSFEFACRTQREKDDMVDLLKQLRDELCVSIVIYTHEAHKRFTNGSRRGPFGALSILASSISTIEKLAPELMTPENTVTPEEQAAGTYAGFVETDVSYQPMEEVQARLRDAPPSILPRQHVRTDGSLTDERFDMVRNAGTASVKK